MADDVNLLAGSLIGAWAGAEWATRLKSETLHRLIAILLVVIAGVLTFGHDATTAAPLFTDWARLWPGSPLASSPASSPHCLALPVASFLYRP